MRDTTLPLQFVWSVVAICLLPFILIMSGVDFGTHAVCPVADEFVGLRQPARIDVMHHTLAGSFVHTILEWSAFCVAIFTVSLSFVHYKLRGDIATPIIGVAFFTAGCMDAFHTLAADRLIDSVAENRNLIPFTWAICRIFNVLITASGVGFFLLFRNRIKAGSGFGVVIGISLLFGCIAYAIIHICATSAGLPQTMFPDAVVTRPYDIAPLILFAAAGGALFMRFYRIKPSLFSCSIVISVIPHTATQAYMAFGSTELFDSYFNVAHFLKIVAYTVPLTGMIFDYILTFQTERSTALRLKAEMARREESERILQASTVYADKIVQAMTSSLIVSAPDGKIKSVNGATLNLLGYREEELIGRLLGKVIEDDAGAGSGRGRSTIRSLINEGYVNSVEKTYIAKSGGRIPVLFSGSTLRDDSDAVQAVICSAHSIAARKLLEEKKKEAIESKTMLAELKDTQIASLNIMEDLELDRRSLRAEIVERKRLEEENLQWELQMMQRAKLASLGEIATGVAHEINQPLTFINSMICSFLMDLDSGQIDTEGLRKELEMSRTQAARIDEIVQHMRTFGRRDDVRHEHFSVKTVLDNTLLLMDKRIRLQIVELEVNVEPDLPLIMGNANQIEQVLINLLQNALGAFPKRVEGARICIDISLTDDKQSIHIRVSDNGMGVAKEYAEKIFEPFFTTKGVGEGTGLGLSIVYGIIRGHNGTIACESEPGKGAVFTVMLPVGDV